MSTPEVDLRYAEAWELGWVVLVLMLAIFLTAHFVDLEAGKIRELDNRVQQLERTR